LGEIRPTLERMREAEVLAEQLDDDRRCGRVYALTMDAHIAIGEFDEARRRGTRALAIARALGDLDLRILTTGFLENVHYFLADSEQVFELAKGNLATLPPNRIHDKFGRNWPASVSSRNSLVFSLCQLGRFSEAAEYQAEAMCIAEATHHAYTIGCAHHGAMVLHTSRGDWTQPRVASEHMIAALWSGHVVDMLPRSVTYSARILAQLGETSPALSRLHEGQQLIERATTPIPVRFDSYLALGRACLLLRRLDEARRLVNRGVESFVSQPGFSAEALLLLGDIGGHPDRFDADSAETNYRKALALAEPRGMRP